WRGRMMAHVESSIAGGAEHETVVLARDVTGMAGRRGAGADDPPVSIAAAEALVAPAAGRRVPLRVLVHHAGHLARTLGDRVVRRGRLQQVEHDDGAVGELAGPVALHGLLVGIEVMNA